MKKKKKNLIYTYIILLICSLIPFISLGLPMLKYSYKFYSLRVSGYNALTLLWDDPLCGFGSIFYLFLLIVSFISIVISIMIILNYFHRVNITKDMKKITFLVSFLESIFGVLSFIFYLAFVLNEDKADGGHSLAYFSYINLSFSILVSILVRISYKFELKEA